MRTVILANTPDTRRRLLASAPGPVVNVFDLRTKAVPGLLRRIESDAQQGRVDAVLMSTLDLRVAPRTLLHHLWTLLDSGVAILSLDPPLSLGPRQADLVSFFAKLLDGHRQSNIQAGVERARREGRTPGRPRAVIPDRVFELADQGLSLRAISRQTGLGASTIQRALAARRLLYPQVEKG